MLPTLRHEALPRPVPASEPWTTVVEDPKMGSVRLGGRLSMVAGSETVVVIVHGLGGDASSGYCHLAASAAERHGLASLRLALRGADCSGEDVHHAGLTADLTAAMQSKELSRFKHVVLLGYSLGGHLALCTAIEQSEPRLRAVAAICPPLDLAAVQRSIDRVVRWPYRQYMLHNLKRIHAAAARRGRAAAEHGVVAQARTIRQFDELAIVPRFGFRDVDDYYARASVGSRLGALEVPALVVASTRDPLIPASTLVASVRGASPALEARWIDGGGHVNFPLELADIAVSWLCQRRS